MGNVQAGFSTKCDAIRASMKRASSAGAPQSPSRPLKRKHLAPESPTDPSHECTFRIKSSFAGELDEEPWWGASGATSPAANKWTASTGHDVDPSIRDDHAYALLLPEPPVPPQEMHPLQTQR